MKLYAPKYYKDFVCIADKCRHSCCIGWEIDIDDKTAKKYAAFKDGYGKIIKESVDFEDTPHFKLKANDRCPHLADSGLCNIILNLGDSCLCDICREHPRFYNYTSRGKEVGLGMSCEEAARIILNSDEYADMIELCEVNGKPEAAEIDAVTLREKIYSLLSDDSVPYTEKLQTIYGAFGVSPSVHTDVEWREILDSLEYLDEAHKELFANYSSDISTPEQLEKPLTRALAYFIYRHTSEAYDEADFIASLGFCLFTERLLASIASDNAIEAARIVSEELEYSEDNTDAIKFEFLF